ncbi:MAG: NifB/NifX family molybdenum-iron cluster-binding protein [Candidatus Aminicenantes bacterium]|nr:NifB/NifX family molybdenum-iron cluster-binding protein [Candidatus Aminicenantes bacterium]
MKIAIATEGEIVAQHFGRCSSYTIVEAEDGKVMKREVIANPGHAPGFLPKFLSELGVDFILSGGMGQKAITLFHHQGVEPIVGVSGSIDDVINNFLNGELETGESDCDHGKDGHGHDCGNH